MIFIWIVVALVCLVLAFCAGAIWGPAIERTIAGEVSEGADYISRKTRPGK